LASYWKALILAIGVKKHEKDPLQRFLPVCFCHFKGYRYWNTGGGGKKFLVIKIILQNFCTVFICK
jgi:hypothetical protein